MVDLTALVLLTLSLLAPAPHRAATTRATRYADTARDEGGTPRCRYELAPAAFRALHPLRVAHRTLPCGTVLVVEAAGGRRTLAAVLDRGPWNRVSGAPGAPFRGDLDVSPRPADALGLSLRVGRLRVRYWPTAWQPFAVVRRPRYRRGDS